MPLHKRHLAALLIAASATPFVTGCTDEADHTAPPVDTERTLFAVSFHVWNGGVVAELPVMEWQLAKGLAGGVPPVAFAFYADGLTPVAATQQLGPQSATELEWAVDLVMVERERSTRRRDSVRVGMAADLSEITFRHRAADAPQLLGPPAVMGPVAVVVRRAGGWFVYPGPTAFEDSGVPASFESEVMERLQHTPVPPRPPAPRSPVRL